MARLIAALFLAAAPAAGPVLPHPQGLPGIVRALVHDDVVRVEWVLADDDEAALAAHLAGRSRQAYFHDNFRVDGCTRERDYVFRCERPPTTLRFHSTLLLDLDRAYRTLLTVDMGDRTERRFLGADATAASVGVTDDVGRAERIADRPVRNLPALERRVVGLMDGPLSLGALLAGLAGAVVVGAVHALSPGHGKSVAAAYLVGSQGRAVHALALGGVVAAMHSASVVALGLVTWFATASVEPGRVLDALRVGAGLFVLGVGAYLVVTRSRHRRSHDDHHDHDHSDHHHDHPVRPFSRKGVVALGLSGGLLPSPSALVVVLAGLSAGRMGLALALVAAYSVGLAGAVALAGLAVLKGRDLVELRTAAWLPLAAAYAILAAGVVLTVTGLAG